jgi:hypothetical protein
LSLGSFFTELKSNAIVLIVLEVQLLFSAGKDTTLFNTIQAKSVNLLDIAGLTEKITIPWLFEKKFVYLRLYYYITILHNDATNGIRASGTDGKYGSVRRALGLRTWLV